MKNLGLSLLFACFSLGVVAQELVNYDYAYLPSIRSIQLYPGQQQESIPPLMSLQKSQQNVGALTLSFDELAEDARYLSYKFQHCDQFWNPSDLEEYEYATGINDQQLRASEFSFNTRVSYVHYELSLPNQDQSLTKSGNYLIHIYDEDTEEPILTKRFIVYENIVTIKSQLIRPFNVENLYTHQELKFELDQANMNLRDPNNFVSCTILQNGRWDKAIVGEKPTNSIGRSIFFNNLGAYSFPAGKEFRHFDIRTLDYPTRQVAQLDKLLNGFEVKLVPEKSRGTDKFWSDNDLNGTFIIDAFDLQGNSLEDAPTSGDYADVLFSLQRSQPLFDQDVYILGGFNNWTLDPRYKMEYVDQYEAYFGEAKFKQGVYDYLYACVPIAGGPVDFNELEGNWHETENSYLILVYYRPFGQRYDQIIGASTTDRK